MGPLLKKLPKAPAFLYCIDLRIGCFVIGYGSLIKTAVLLIFNLDRLNKLLGDDDKDLTPYTRDVAVGNHIAGVSLVVLGGIIPIFVILGLHLRDDRYLYLYSCFAFFIIILQLAVAVVFIYFLLLFGSCVYGALVFLNAYCLIIVNSLYQENRRLSVSAVPGFARHR